MSGDDVSTRSSRYPLNPSSLQRSQLTAFVRCSRDWMAVTLPVRRTSWEPGLTPSPCSSRGPGPSPRVLCTDYRQCLRKEQHARAGRAVRPLRGYKQARAGVLLGGGLGISFPYVTVVPSVLLILSKLSVVLPVLMGSKAALSDRVTSAAL